jgi:single-strand DNA-binding protein
MRGFNKVILMGNLTRDPQLKYLPNQTPVVEFGLAVSRKWRSAQGEDREDVCFVECSAFAKAAELINQYCTKGKALFVEGRLKLDQWEDKQGGGKRSKLSVVVENFQFLGGPGGGAGGPEEAEGGERPPSRAPSRPPAAAGGNRPAAPQPPYGDEQKFQEDDIPF